jgi:regulator of protease activity HflC (stomatin/prohibitin superfamily)
VSRNKTNTTESEIMNAEIIVGGVWLAVGSGAGFAAFAAQRTTFEVPEGFCGLLSRHGESLHRISPGRHRFWRSGYAVRLVDMRQRVLQLAAQDLATADGASVRVGGELTFQIIQAETAVAAVVDYELHLIAAGQCALRSVVGAMRREEVLNGRDEVEREVLARVGVKADRIGIEVVGVEINF